MNTWPTAPWRLAGEVVTTKIKLPAARRLPVPLGVTAMGSSAVVWCGHWSNSPVGAFSELVLAVPARIGPRIGLCVLVNIVTSPDARMAGQIGWGFPRRVGRLDWMAHNEQRELHWTEGDVVVRAALHKGGRPYATAFRALQRRADGPVVVPIRVVGWSRPAALTVDAPDGNPFAAVRGAVKGRLVSGRQVMLQPARRPIGSWRTLMAPLQAPDRGLSPG